MVLPTLSAKYILNYSSLLRITLKILISYIKGISFPLNWSDIIVFLSASLYLIK